MRTGTHDLRYGWRMLWKTPGFTAVAVITLALGIGANSTIFSWINSTLFNPIPGVAHTSDLISLMRGERSEHPTPPFSYLDYVDLRQESRSFSGLLAYHDDYMSLTGTDKPERTYGAVTSANYFDVLGVRPILGRAFLPEEEKNEGAAVAVISYGMWQNRFASDRSLIGQTIQINRHPFTVIGVAPPGFQGCKTGLRADLWMPLGMGRVVWDWPDLTDRGRFWLQVLGRLRPGFDQKQAAGELGLLMQRIVEQFPNEHRGPNEITLDPLWRSPFGANVYLYKTLPMLLALAAVLLLLACANVANLLLVRALGRQREIAIRLSLGASRWRLVRQLLVESLLLALAGGGVAVLLTTWTAGTFAAFFPANLLPLTLNGHMDGTVLSVTLAVSVLTALAFGMLPALRMSSLTPVTVLKEEAGSISGGLHKSRLSRTLVVGQISLSLLLLICAGLFVRSLRNAQRFDPGFDPNHVEVAFVDLGLAGYSDAQGIEFERQLLAKVRSLPGVESATLADFSPLSFTLHSDRVQPEGYVPRLHESMEIDRSIVGPGYLEMMKTPLISGRDFTEQDTAKSQRVAIVNKAFVDRYWPGQDAIGKRIQTRGRTFTVVGVAGNGKYRRLIYDAEPGFFFPLFQDYQDLIIIHARVAGDPAAFALTLENTVHDLNPDLPVFNVSTLKESMQMGSIFERIAVVFAGSFGLLALLLATVGIYGVVAYSTRQRTHEIGIRMALGASQGAVFRQVLTQGFRLMLVGLVIGVAVSLVLTRFLRSMLFGVGSSDALTFGSVALVLCLAALVACFVPARRATKIDPMVALRYE